MYRIVAAAFAVAATGWGTSPLSAQTVAGPPATMGPVAQGAPPVSSTAKLPERLSLAEALALAAARSPRIVDAQSQVDAARARVRQAGFRVNPTLSVEAQNFLGSGAFEGFRSTELTASINQQIDLAGHRKARVTVAEARLFAETLRLAIARADLIQNVRQRFARAIAAREQLAVARDNADRSRELARIAGELVDAGREPPLRALRARAALARERAAVEAAQAEEQAARAALGTLLGSKTPPAQVVGAVEVPMPASISAPEALDVLLARAETAIAEAQVSNARAEGRVDPSIGLGVRAVRETGDVGLVAGISLPLPVFDRNQGNIAAAGAERVAAEARLVDVENRTRAEIDTARAELRAADARLTALRDSGIGEAKEALRLADLSYRAGKSSLIELLDAQRSLALLQTDLIDARRARAEAAAALARLAAPFTQGTN
ncbi:TolC family protein [Stakelama marina]|uniref:TolC family protein n=1 Tax=Stakelama marina TaxID=2826939 RepID=A0A8T4IDX6_9SPHN|nr:TolC family protein [Stakelama marina]MBR0552770.1 TolC family protein [Stakelama marina]